MAALAATSTGQRDLRAVHARVLEGRERTDTRSPSSSRPGLPDHSSALAAGTIAVVFQGPSLVPSPEAVKNEALPFRLAGAGSRARPRRAQLRIGARCRRVSAFIRDEALAATMTGLGLDPPLAHIAVAVAAASELVNRVVARPAIEMLGER